MKKQRTIKWGELYKSAILTAWLIFSGCLMWGVYSNPILLLNPQNFWSNIIAIIGIVVATLIGWQIYSAMDWNSKAERLSRLENANQSITTEIKNNRFFSEASVHFIHAILSMTEADANPTDNKDNYSFAYKSLLHALSLYVGPSIEDPVEECIQYMFGALQAIRLNDVPVDEDFHATCEKYYQIINEHKNHLTKAQQGKVEQIHKRRLALGITKSKEPEE